MKKKTARTAKRTRKKEVKEMQEDSNDLEVTSDAESGETAVSDSGKDSKKSPRKTQKKGIVFSSLTREAFTGRECLLVVCF